MRRISLLAFAFALSTLLVSCESEKVEWDPAVEQATFTEIDRTLPMVREALMDLSESINKRITSKKHKEEALERFNQTTNFVDVLQFYYLPTLNARAHIARAYREISYGMYSEASADIKKAIDNLNKAALKSTDRTRRGFEEVKRGLMEVETISDQTASPSMTRLSNAAKKLNMLIEKIKPVVEMTEEGEALIDGQF